jgi:hypothetical protein
MWIFEDIVVSHNAWIQCGSARAPWEDSCMKLLDLLVIKRGCEANDSRDMVSAVAGITMKVKSWNSISITYENRPPPRLSIHGTSEIPHRP